MSTNGTPIRAACLPRCVRNRNTRAEQTDAAEPSAADTPYRLLWSTGIVAIVLSIVAFVLWGINGTGTLFDMMVALCS
jgi:hypothetical protein